MRFAVLFCVVFWVGVIGLVGCKKPSEALLDKLAAKQSAVEEKAPVAWKGCVAPIDGSKYKDNIVANFQIFQWCQTQALGRAEESLKEDDSADQVFLRSCFLSYFELIGVPKTKEEKAEAATYCEAKLEKESKSAK